MNLRLLCKQKGLTFKTIISGPIELKEGDILNAYVIEISGSEFGSVGPSSHSIDSLKEILYNAYLKNILVEI